MYNILNKINSPIDLKNLSNTELETLSAEIRTFLIDSVSKTGGHLASNLGVVELTIAMHTVFDIPKDKIVYDVGHQSYVHKILTGRKNEFSTLRQYGGISGFPKRSESEYDSFNTGHSSTSISAALGIAKGRDLNGDNYNVIALFGDGALTGGMIYEAINDVGRSKTKLILILNDNAMSISKNVGAISKYLRNLRSQPRYYKSKQIVENTLNKFRFGGKFMAKSIRSFKKYVKRIVIPTTLFDDLGIEYMGPIDGHNISSLISIMERAKNFNKPVIIHIHTKKGKGYSLAESNPQKFHGISKFDIQSGNVSDVKSKADYSSIFGNSLCSIAQQNSKVVAITGAMPLGTGLGDFCQKFKNRFFDVGIAEQHAITFAAGLATVGYIPVVPLYSSFLQRAYDQTLHDVCLQNLHVVFGIDRAGIVGQDGETHQGVYDISFLSHMPNMTILSPSTFFELSCMLDYAINTHTTPIAIRYPRGSIQANIPEIPYTLGDSILVTEGTDITILATGRMVKTAQDVCEILLAKNIKAEVISLRTIKPLDTNAILSSARKTKNVITIEDNVKIGGVGCMVSTLLQENNIHARFSIFAFDDKPITHGNIAELDKLYGVDSKSIAEYAEKSVKGEK